jgi:hypothetical protein
VDMQEMDRWQDWQVGAQVRQFFCTPGHTKLCATSFAVALVRGCDRSWMDWNAWSRSEIGTYGRDLLAEISQIAVDEHHGTRNW